MDALSLSMYQKYLRIFFVFIYLLLQPYSCLPFPPAAHLLLPRRSLVFFLLVTYSSFPGFPPVQSRILHHVAVPNVYSILSYIERAGCMFLY